VSEEVDYIGISQGGILGAVLLGVDPFLRRGVLHVGGGGWTPMMTHSSNWEGPKGRSLGYGDAIRATIPEATDRSYLFALWQVVWDEWDPITYGKYWLSPPSFSPHPLPAGRKVYYPYAIDDAQVPNFSSHTVLRAFSVPLLTPSVTKPYGISLVGYPSDLPLLAGEWDVGGGEPAHSEVRSLKEFGTIVREFIREGRVDDPCRGKPCRFRLTPEPSLIE